MKIEFSDSSEAYNLIGILFSKHVQPVYLLDESKTIRYSNPAFSSFLKKHPEEIENRGFCETVGCTYCSQTDHAESPHCKICPLDDLVSPNGSKKAAVVRQFKLGDGLCLKYLQLNSFEVQIQNKLLSLAIISDLTDEIQLQIDSGEITGLE